MAHPNVVWGKIHHLQGLKSQLGYFGHYLF